MRLTPTDEFGGAEIAPELCPVVASPSLSGPSSVWRSLCESVRPAGVDDMRRIRSSIRFERSPVFDGDVGGMSPFNKASFSTTTLSCISGGLAAIGCNASVT